MTIEELKSDIKWWETKRWFYNLGVAIFGILAMYFGISSDEYSFTLEDFLGIIIWGIGANIFYSLGILVEILDWYYLENKIGIKRFRMIFLIIGFFFSCFSTFWYSWLYFAKPHLW